MGLLPSTRNHSDPSYRSGALTPFSQFWMVFLLTPRPAAMNSWVFPASERDRLQILAKRLFLSDLDSLCSIFITCS